MLKKLFAFTKNFQKPWLYERNYVNLHPKAT